MLVELIKDANFSIDGWRVVHGRKGEKHNLPENIAQSLITQGKACEPSENKAFLGAPENKSGASDAPKSSRKKKK